MTVTRINQRREDELSEQFDQLVDGALTLCVVTVGKDGKPGYLLPDDEGNDLALVGALDSVKLLVQDRLLADD
jgi:hypothetical protein